MRRNISHLCLLVAMAANAQSIDLEGTVSNASGKAVAGAIVSLSGQSLRDTTDSKGAYALIGTASSVETSEPTRNLRFDNGILSLELEQRTSVKIEVSDLGGRRLKTIGQSDLQAGIHRFDVVPNLRGANTIVVKATIGGQTQIFRCFSTGRNGTARSMAGAGRTASVADTLRVAARGYVGAGVAISSYARTLDIALDTDTVSSRIATTPGTLALIPAKSVLSTQTRGYAEYVPPGYKDSADWPCIVYFHGDGELGDGTSATTLALLENSGLTAMVHQDNWDTRHRFVVLAPQFSSYDDRSGSNVNDFIEYAKSVYRIDTNRIYLTAVSGGGVALGNYLVGYSGGIAAAILPVSCYVPPIASSARWSEVPAWFLLGSADSTVQPSNVVENYTVLMGSSTLKATPKITLYTGVAHEGASFNLSYSPTTNNNRVETTFSGIELSPYSNIYDWLLKYHR